MSGSWLIGALLLTFLLAAAAAFATRGLGAATQRVVEPIHVLALAIALVAAVLIVADVAQGQRLFLLDSWLIVDPLGCIFLGLVVVVGLLTGLYSIGYLRHDIERGEITATDLSRYYGFFHLFLFTMVLVVTSNNLVMMWVSIEATTLTSVFLVGFYGRRTSLEAAWKYVVICTVGVAFGLYGTVLVFANANAVLANSQTAILWTEVVNHAVSLDPATIPIAFAFVLIGFGTKAGLVPMHTWMPDAYSEAPSPSSALLTAALANCALLVIIRYAVITSGAIGPDFPEKLFLIFGILSIGIAAPLIFVQRDLKRLLAYSSVENMGLIAVGLGLGGPLGVSAALLHAMNHGLAKTLMFCCSGNVLMKYGTRNLDAVRGVLRVAPVSGFLLIAGALALAGAPPFNIFVSEFLTVTAGIKAGYAWLMVVCLLLLTVVLAAFTRFIGGSILGPAPERVRVGDPGTLILAPLGLALALVLLMGLHIPAPIAQVLAQATSTVVETPAAAARAAPSRDLVEDLRSTYAMGPQPDLRASVSGCGHVQPGKGKTCPN
jgi:hydrogenase-4 component F